jgi:spermidine/putrescine transport system ATP-binding protein
MSSFLRFENITRRFGNFTAVDDVTLDIERGESFSLLGPSGCGKTTLLRIVAGFDQPDSGRVWLDGKDITGLPPNERPVNTVFQNYALFPHMTVRENIGFGPKIAGMPAADLRREVDQMLELVDLASHAGKKPGLLSGGQKQRVAIARALVNKPKVLLLDEPLAALDLKLRQRLLVELHAIHKEVGITFIYVTHDQSEAMSISDRIAVMNKGAIEQTGIPAQVYEAPRTSFVAAFIGDTNFLDGCITDTMDAGLSRCRIEDFGNVVIANDKSVKTGDRINLSLRPEKLMVSRQTPEIGPMENAVMGVVEDIIYLGSRTRYWVRCGAWKLCAEVQPQTVLLDRAPLAWGDTIWLHWHASDGFLLEAQEAPDGKPRPPTEV